MDIFLSSEIRWWRVFIRPLCCSGVWVRGVDIVDGDQFSFHLFYVLQSMFSLYLSITLLCSNSIIKWNCYHLFSFIKSIYNNNRPLHIEVLKSSHCVHSSYLSDSTTNRHWWDSQWFVYHWATMPICSATSHSAPFPQSTKSPFPS